MWQKTIKLPQQFVFKNENLRTMVDVLVRLSKLWRKKIHIDFSRVTQVRKGDLMVLIAQLEKLDIKRKQIRFKNIPKNLRGLFNEKVVHFQANTNILNNANFAKKINPTIVENIIRDLSKLGINKNSIHGHAFYERTKALLTEIMGNAVEHGIRNRDINYWLTSEIDNRQLIVTFVDMGKGIAHSHKKSRLPLKYRIMGIFSDNKIVVGSLFGKLPSSTQQPNRGNGLPEIRTIIENEFVSEFILITNRTLIQYKDNAFISTKIPNFEGTYYCWTISKNNFEKWKTESQ
jgi:ABC-type transporter Mla MlaB component